MLRKEVILVLAVLSLCAARSQPVLCTEESQCSAGYYCEANAHICRECLSCQDLKREPPIIPSACIKSIADCGDCMKGWEKDGLGDVNSACVLTVPGGTEHYAWWPWLLGIGILIFLALMVGIVVYVWMNPYIFENFKLRGNSQAGTVSTDIRTVARASAPEAPPPYTPNYSVPYSAVPSTESPCPPQHQTGDTAGLHSEEEGPFLKWGVNTHQGDARESSVNQAATVYELPNYMRQDHPSNPEPPTVTEVISNLPIDEEETMDSPWTPNGPSTADINANVSEASGVVEDLPTSLAVARETTLIEQPEPKRIRLAPMPANNRNRDSNSAGDSSQGSFSGGQNSQPYNFITQITNVVQINRTS